MTREQILSEYTVSDAGTIQSPGKFEGEMLYVPYFYDAYLNGMADEDDGEVLTFNVDATDRAMFPKLANTSEVKLYERSDGFVCEV